MPADYESSEPRSVTEREPHLGGLLRHLWFSSEVVKRNSARDGPAKLHNSQEASNCYPLS